MNKLSTYLHVKVHRQERTRQSRSRTQTANLTGWGLAVILLTAGVVAFAALEVAFTRLTANLPSVETLPALLDPVSGSLLIPTRVYDRTGQTMLGELSLPGIQRRFLHLEADYGEAFSADLINATVAAIDPSFWTNPGYVLTGLNNPDSHPTLAQKLVYQLFFSDEPATFNRAVRERILAGQITARYGRKQVLEWYLNSVYYGRQAYGAEAAARLYFNKSASQLNLAEATLLAAVSSSPALNPLDAPTAAKTLQVETLRRMSSSGMIAEKDVLAALQTPLTFATAPIDTRLNQALVTLTAGQAARSIGEQRLERGGYKLITTVDTDLQTQFECVLSLQVSRLTTAADDSLVETACDASRLLPDIPGNLQYPSGSISAGAVAIDPSTGEVLAYSATGPAASNSHLPGSAVTPFIYLAGYTSGITPGTLYWDIPSRMPSQMADLPSPDRKYHGPQRQRLALVNDYMGHAAQIESQTGIDKLKQIYRLFGIDTGTTDSTALLRLPWLGGSVSLLDMSQAYGILANGGIAAGQSADSEVTPAANILLTVQDSSGKILLDHSKPAARTIVSPQLAYLLTDMLADDSARQPLESSAGNMDTGLSAAVKVSQTAYGKDSWTIGYTPNRLVGVWAGLDAQLAPSEMISPRVGAGIWSALLQTANSRVTAENWTKPDGVATVTVCDPSGDLPTSDCPTTVHENFLDGTQPVTQDHLYRSVQVNRETGRLATVFTLPEVIESREYFTIPSDAAEWAKQQGYEFPPDSYDVVQKPAVLPAVHFTTPEMFMPVKGIVDLVGTASARDFSYYRIQAGQGLNPQEWIQVGSSGSSPVVEGTLASWDTTGLNGLYALQLQVVNASRQVTTAVIQVTVDNQPPAASVIYPAGQTELSAGSGDVTLMTSVSDNYGVDRVEFYLDGNLLTTTDVAPYIGLWKPTAGTHTLQVWAYDPAGNVGKSAEVGFTVKP
jgi:membrane peptidoglycan carboxypeptidase